MSARYESALTGSHTEAIAAVFSRQKLFGEHAASQLDDEGFFAPPAEGMNSPAVLCRHIGGNLQSRFTDLLTSDGEKPWRDRDAELAPIGAMTPDAAAVARREIMQVWDQGWSVLFETIASLRPEDLDRVVVIRGVEHSVMAALARSMDHIAAHVGQLNLLARLRVGTERWRWFTLPPGGTAEFNAALRSKAQERLSGAER
ncbi:MAG: DUF1572 family protein [Planctomycetota bacterium]